jgi:putative transposase
MTLPESRESTTENATLARALLADLVDRGLDLDQAILFVIDGGKGPYGARSRTSSGSTRSCIAAIATRDATSPICCPSAIAPAVFGEDPRRVGAERRRARRPASRAGASELDRTWPDAAGSLREGMHDTLTLMRLGITGQLARRCRRRTRANR